MDIQQIFQIFLARYKIVVFLFLLVMLAALIFSLQQTNRYETTASVLLDTKTPDPLLGMMSTPMNYMPTQIEIIKSDRVAQKVVKLLKLDGNPQVRQQWQAESGGKEPLVVWLGKLLGKGISVKPSQETSIVNITYSATEPSFAALAANSFAQAYIDTNIELKVEPARQYAAWFQDRAKELRADLEKAQAKLAEYQQKTGFVASEAHQPSDENIKIADLSKQLTLTETEAADAQSKQKHAGSTDSMPDVMRNPIIQSIKEQIITQKIKLEELGRTLGKNHPQYQATQDHITALERNMVEESTQIMNSFKTANLLNKQREIELRATINSHKQKAIENRDQLDQIAVLQKEVEAAQKAYDMIVQRFTDISLQSQSTQTNISVLNPATQPMERSSPNILKNLGKAAIIGIVLGFGSMILWELLDRRVRSLAGLGIATGVPVLVELTTRNKPESVKTQLMKFIRAGLLKLKFKKKKAAFAQA
jgi:chain length determinant protein EpsF